MTKPGDSPANNWEEKYEKEHKLRQEAEGELTIVKTITIDSSPEMRVAKAKIKELQDSLERFKKENNECYNRIADLTEALKSKESEKEDRKDKRTKIQATQQSELIDQRTNQKPPKNFESSGNDTLTGGFDLGVFDPR